MKFTDAINSIYNGVVSLNNELHEKLALNYIMLDIEFGKDKFCLRPSTDRKESVKQVKLRIKLINLLLMDAIKSSLKGDKDPFNRISTLLINIPDKQDIESPIDASSYEEIKVDAQRKSVEVNYESYQGKMEDPSRVFGENCGCGHNDAKTKLLECGVDCYFQEEGDVL